MIDTIEAAIAYLADALPGVRVVPAYGVADQAGALPASCIVEAAGDGGPRDGRVPLVMQRYLLRFYGLTDLAALDTYNAANAALYNAYGVKTNVTVRNRWRLYWMTLSAPTGPLREPESERPVVLATALARWDSQTGG